MANSYLLPIFLLLVLTPLHTASLWLPIFSGSSTTKPSPTLETKDVKAEFSLQSFENQEGKKVLEDVRLKQLSLNTCWQEAYRNLFASCSEIIVNEEKHKRLAWQLSDCFVKDSGRPSLPSCSLKVTMRECRKKLQDFENDIYLQFFIQTNAICHQLQADAFKRDTERLINDLKVSAHTAEEKLEVLEGKAEGLLQGSAEIHSSLNSIDSQTQQIAQKSSNVEEQINDVLKNSEVIFKQTKGIAASQSVLQEGQVEMKQKLETSMEFLHESYESLGDGMEVLKKEALDLEKEIIQVGDLMSSKMTTLQSTADDISDVAGASLDKQKQVLSGQTKALEESRATLQQLAKFSHKQQAELLQRQDQMQQAHDRLIQNSQSILAAQEEFESKQAIIFHALDKLFALHSAILVESRFIKSFFFYCLVIFIVYMLTSAKQTFAVRARLYFGLCLTFAFEILIIRFMEDDFQTQSWITSKVFFWRSLFLFAALLQIIYSIFTYRDYEVLNYKMLQELKEKIDIMEQNIGKQLCAVSMESDLDMYSWNTNDLAEEVNSHHDPDYVVPEEFAENSITCSIPRSYNLRPRRQR